MASVPQTAPSKADLGKRFIAAIIDGILAAGVSFIPIVGGIIGGLYILLRDGLELDFMDRRSIGKKLIKLRPVRLDGQPMDPVTSAKRNLPLAVGAVGTIFWIIPFLGWIVAILFGLVGLVIGIIELVLVLTDAEGRRMGDKLAGTKVIEVAE
ncbi:RDD family protein [Thermoanaerobaculum aquaticum]|uniref:RDD family protein n=1 Tax=Thermoanaerobaculum aquaticum TaxID=1312852 RepID=UPI000570E8F0|nr:RDD family protein [Thermoanaerobaculum aquaticum]